MYPCNVPNNFNGLRRYYGTSGVTVQTPLHPSDVAQAPQLEKQSLIEKSALDKGEGSERLLLNLSYTQIK